MTNISLNTGLRSLLTAQFGLETVGHNIANANTPGYSRQLLSIGTEIPQMARGVLVGTGVSARSVMRSVDSLLNHRVLSQVSTGGRLESQLTGMTEIEALLGELDGRGIGTLMDDLFTSISALSADPGDSILQSAMGQAGLAMASQFNVISSDLSSMEQDITAELDVRLAEVNRIANDILVLNKEIAGFEASGVIANDLRDSRELALSELSKRVDATAIEDANGAMRVMVAGNTLVSSSRTYELEVTTDVVGDTKVKIDGASGYVPITGGTIGGLLGMADDFVPSLNSELDELARNLILEFNRVHSTGVPPAGSFESLVGSSTIADGDGDGDLRDELLSNSDLPFDVLSGSLQVNVNDETTGEVTSHKIDISSTHTTVGEFLDALNAIQHLSADIDASGRARIQADAAFTFDFSAKLDPNPDSAGTLGGGSASLGTQPGPFAIADGDTLNLSAPSGGTPVAITFGNADFENINAATADEIAAVINADPSAQSAGIVAKTVEGRLFIQTLAEGSTANFGVDGGTVLSALGLAGFVGSTITGQDNSIDVEVGGTYTGEETDLYTFQPNMDGVVGTTPGMMVDVTDSDGNLVASLDVGPGYTPGTHLDVAEGITVSFGLGEFSATEGDMFALDVVADADTSDVLVALGLNSFFTGTGAADIGVRKDLEMDPSRIATSLGGSAGDNRVLMQMLGLQSHGAEGLGGETFSQSYGNTIGEFGFEVSSTVSALESNELLQISLNQLKESVSGVNVDEELVDMVKFEQAFAAASQFINVVNELQGELLNLL